MDARFISHCAQLLLCQSLCSKRYPVYSNTTTAGGMTCMDLDRRQTIKALGGVGVLAAGGIGATRLGTSEASAQGHFTVQDVTATSTDGRIEDIIVTGDGEITWENMEPTFMDLFLGAKREDRGFEWGIDPIVHEDQLDGLDTFRFTLADIWAPTPISLTDSPDGGYDLSVFEPDSDERQRSTTLIFEFSGLVDGPDDSASIQATDIATITIERTAGEATASITDTTIELEVVT